MEFLAVRGKIDIHIMRHIPLAFALILIASAARLPAQGREFQLIKITKNLIATPEFTYAGAQQFPPTERNLWLEAEVEFAAAPAYTDELTFKYFVLYNGKLLSGEVTHTNIAAGRENRSVMYVSPRTLARFGTNRPFTLNAVQNIAVQIVQQGAVKDELSLARATAQWFARMPAAPGFLLNKDETPFAPLYWDRYEQIKTAPR